MLQNTKISTKLIAMAAVPIVLVALLASVTLVLVRQVSINSPAYDRISMSKRFADQFTTPDLTLLKAHMYAGQLVQPEDVQNNPRSGIEEAIGRAEQDYEDALAAWQDRVPDQNQLRQLRGADAIAKEYFKHYRHLKDLVDDDRDKEALEYFQETLSIDYLRHESAIQNIVGISMARISNEEVKAAETTRRQLSILAVSVILLIAFSGILGYTTVRSITGRIRKLTHVAVVELPDVIENVKKSTLAGDEVPSYRPIELGGNDELTDATHAFNAVLGTAVELASQQSRLRRSTSEMFVNLGRRNHKLLSRTLSYISELERDERDPSTLQKLFKLDHLATRMRRHAESLLVLAGSAPLRTWSRPVPVGDVLRAALSEIEAYDRVDVSSLEPIAVKGSAVSDLAHLMAELLENATTFSPPQSRVRILGRGGSEGYTLVVVDEGVGMKPEVMATANRLIAAAERDDSSNIGDARMLGLGVVGRLAARHGLSVNLGASPMGGVVAWVVLPPSLLSPISEPQTAVPSAPEDSAPSAVVVEAQNAPSSPSPYAATAVGGPPPISQPIPIAPAAALPSGGIPVAPVSPPAQRPSPETTQPAPSAGIAGLAGVAGLNGTPIGSGNAGAVTGATPPPAGITPVGDAGQNGAPAEDATDGADGTGFTNLPHRRPGASEGPFGAPATADPAPSPFRAFHPHVQPTPGHDEPYRAAELFTPAKGVPAAPVFTDNPYGRTVTAGGPAVATGSAPGSDSAPVAEPAQGVGAPLRKRVRGAQLPDTADAVPEAPVARPVDRTADTVRNALSSFVTGQRSATRATPANGTATAVPTPAAGPAADPAADPAAAPAADPSVNGHAGRPQPVAPQPVAPQADAPAAKAAVTEAPPKTSNASPHAAGADRASTTTSGVDGLAASLPVSPLAPSVAPANGAPAPIPGRDTESSPGLTASGLRRRVRGAQLPEMALPPVTARPPDRTAESVRTALANFTAGRRSAVESSD